MDIGFTCDKYSTFSLSQVVTVFKFLKINSFEFTLSLFDEQDDILHIVKNSNIRLHLPNFGGHGYDFSSALHRSEIKQDIEKVNILASKFNFSYAVFHPPEMDRKHISLDLYWSRLKQIPIPLLLENISILTPQEFSEFYLSAKSRLGSRIAGLCFDIPHAFVAGYDWKKMYQEHSADIKEIHLSDCYEHSDAHMPFNMGVLSLSETLNTLQKYGFNGVLNYEIKPPSARDVVYLFQTYKKTLESINKPLALSLKLKIKLISAAASSKNPVIRNILRLF
ncbi:TIM barrel protein [bacterium]|nr:TIM barrel protein [bacterium]